MKIKLEVLASTCIKQKKPWPRITWLGEEKESVFLLDDKNIQEINLLSGKTKKKIPQLQTFLKNVIVLSTSRNGAWLAGMLKTGEIFLWNKDQDIIKTVPAIEESKKVAMAVQEHSLRLCLRISGKGNKILLATPDVCVLLWESIESNATPSQISAMGQWSQIIPEASIVLPAIEEKETVVSADFIENEILGDCCFGSFAFYSEDQLVLIFLKIKWQENSLNNASSVPCQIHWAQQTCSLLNLAPSCESVKSRGALLTAYSHDGLVLAVALNQKDLQATQILFMSTKNFITTSGSLKGCGSKNPKIPSKLIRSYWISDMSWTPDSLFLVCMLKRGSLIIMTCLGELMTLITYGCSVEFGPAEFIPLHPLITHRSQNSFLNSHDSSVSEGDFMRQRFSVTCHSSLPYLIASDGYMVTVLKFSSEFSPSTYTKSLLLDSAQRLEKLHHNLITFKSEGKKQPLQSLSSLRANLLQYENQLSTFSGTPKFLQEEEGATELIEEVSLFQECNEESSDDNFFRSNSYILGSQKADFTLGDEGQLEFASMFDTIHAIDGTDRKKDGLLFELNHIQKNLIAAWRVGTSRSIKEKDILLNFNIRCIVHFFNILQHVKLKELDHPVKNQSWIQCVLNCFHQFLTVLSWENQHRQTLGHLMKFTMQTLKLILAEQQDHLFSTNLLGGFSLLKMVIHYLNAKKIPQYEVLLADLNGNNKVELDSIDVPLFQSTDWNSHQKHSALHSMLICSLPMANRTENQEKRLTVIWRHLYKYVIWYWAQLSRKVNNSNKSMTEIQIAQEIPVTKALASHIQAILQSSGESLEQLLNLNSVNGEEEFLIGSYKKSVEAWERAFQETKAKGGKRIPFLQTRYYLAILYCHLYHYNISEAQGLCDHLVYELLKRNQISVRNRDAMTDAEWIKDIHTEAALAVVQSLARFMAAYFTNEPIYILPPHSVGILPPLHIKPDGCLRIIPLQRSRVTEAVRDNGLSCTWTVEYTLDLLLISGLIPEAVWLAQKLGDWKMAVSIGVAYQLYCQSNKSLARSGKVELFLPLYLTPTNIFQEKLQSFLGQPVNNETTNQGTLRHKQLTDPIEEEDANALFSSVEQILKAAVMAEADILSETFQVLMDFAKDHSRKFCGLVPNGLYLPAPPLYCPQPTFEEYADVPLKIERECREKISGIVQRILLLFRAAHCSFAAAQWYIARLKHARRVMQKIHKKGALPPLSDLPENLLKYSKYQSVFLRPSSFGDHNFDAVSCKTIGCFRELCVLCWMLHVRERLSDSCRRYQRARENLENRNEFNRIEFDACIVEYSINALEWACRILPFARFMNIEELVQDIILSLIGELPPIKKVAEILVKAFPSPEDVRVSLRDKYNDLYQRLRHCTVKGPSSEEIMSVVLQATYKVNVKTLKRVIRNIGPIQTNIWEPPEEEIQDSGGSCYDRFSLGTTLSRSTISDFRNFQGCNNAEAADSLSEFEVAEEARKLRQEDPNDLPSYIDVSNRKEWTEKLKDCGGEGDFKKGTRKDLPNQLHMPLVGEWEFERDDDEYIKFLDLFLTYVLERDPLNHSESAVPFLTCFAALLREHELHSLLFDVHTTLIRRQVRTEVQNAFRAGSCYTLGFGFSDSKLAPLWDKKKKDCEKETLADEQPLELSDCDSVMRLTERRGLFGQSQQSVSDSHDSSKTLIFTPALAQCWSTPKTALFQKYICKTGQVNDITQQDEPVPEIHLKFNNISRLLEWMIRWSSKRMVQDPITTGTLQECQPMMQVKICSSAILSSLWILEQRYGNTFQNQNCGLKPQKLCEKSSTIKPKLEKDGAEGTNSSSSEGAPAEIQNGHAYDEPFKNIPKCRTLPEKQNRKKVSHRGHSMVPNIDTGSTTVDISLAEKVAEFLRNEIVVSSETKVYNEDPVSRNPTISVSIKSVEKKKEHLSESKVECQQNEPLMETTEGKCTKLDGATGEVVPSDFPFLFCSEKRAETTSVEITVSDDQPSFTEVSDIPSNNAGVKTEMIDREMTAQPPNTSEVVGQMLQDEMFKLIQLQQINYLSLMQIVGFANLPNTLQQMQQPQPFPLGRNRASNTEANNIRRSPAMQPAGGVQKPTDHQQPTLENNWNVGQKNNSSQEEKNLPDQSQNGNKTRSVHMNDSSALREGQSVGARLMLPLQSSPHQNPARPFPLLSVSLNAEKKPKLIPLAKPLNNAEGFPLLKLKTSYQFQALNFCPVTPRRSSGPSSGPREAWGPPSSLAQNPPNLQMLELTNETGAHLNLNRYDQNIMNQAQEQTKRWAEPVKTGISKQFPVDEYGKKEDSSPLQPFHERLRAEKPLVDNEINSHQAYGPFTEIPLLYLKTSPQSKCSPSTFTTKNTDCRAPLGQTGLPLLYSNLPPLTKFQIPKLIPLQDLIAFEQSQHFVQYPQHKDPPKQMQLLKANIKLNETRQVRSNKKRQKRRIENRIKEKEEKMKGVVTNQQDDSSVLPDAIKPTKESQAELSAGPCDANSLLTSHTAKLSFTDFNVLQNNESDTYISSAALHYLASVGKKTVDLQDASTNTADLQNASTNTDTVLKSSQNIQTVSEELIDESVGNQSVTSASVTVEKSHQDVVTDSEQIIAETNKNQPIVSASASAASASASASETELSPSCVPQALPPELYFNFKSASATTETPLPSSSDLAEQRYISVTDIESGDLLKNLPVKCEPAAPPIVTQPVKSEFPASTKLYYPKVSVTSVLPLDESERQEKSLEIELALLPPRITEEETAGDHLTSSLLHEDFSSIYTGQLGQKISRQHFSGKLQEMDRQLSYLQNLAEKMEKEYSTTKLFGETAKDVSVIPPQEEDDILFFAPGVQLCKAERYSTRIRVENFTEEKDFLEAESSPKDFIALKTPSVSPSVSAANHPRINKLFSDISFKMEEQDERCSEDRLQITGLSDVLDIINDLIVENGVTPSELGLTEIQAKKMASRSNIPRKKMYKAEEDKKELHAWMKRKRKERLAEYMQTLSEKRAKEHSPFHLRKMPLGLSTREIKLQQKKKREKDKVLLSEHHNLRVSEALSLMHDLLSDTAQLPSSKYKPSSGRKSSYDFKQSRIASAGGFHGRSKPFAKVGLGPARSLSNLSCDTARKKDRLCQTPYRRMLLEAHQGEAYGKSNRNQRQWTSSRLDLRSHAFDQTRESVNGKRFFTSSMTSQATEETDDNTVSGWSVPEEIQQILYGTSNVHFKKESLPEDACSIASLNNIDSMSESTSSILSKLDWNAIEAMVANEEEK